MPAKACPKANDSVKQKDITLNNLFLIKRGRWRAGNVKFKIIFLHFNF